MIVLEAALVALAAYLGFGVLFAIPFVLVGVSRLDSDAKHGTWGFRALIFPGTVMLWPLLAGRLVRGAGTPGEKTPHKSLLAERAGVES